MATRSNPILDEMRRIEATGRTITSIRPIGAYPNFVARFRLKNGAPADFKVATDAPYFAKWCVEVTRVLTDRHMSQSREQGW